MDVACATSCFSAEPFERALRHIAELEFSRIDLSIADDSPHLTAGEVLKDTPGVLQRLRAGPTLSIAAVDLRSNATGEEFRQQLEATARLAKQLSTSIITIDAAPVDSSVEDEVARLTRLVRAVTVDSAVLTIATRMGTLAEDPEIALSLCQKVDGLGITLDPSHYLCGPHQTKSFDGLFPFVRHAQLRDSGRRADQLQVKVGRGEVEFGRIVTMLGRFGFKGSLAVSIKDIPESDTDIESEVRKMRLLLESLL